MYKNKLTHIFIVDRNKLKTKDDVTLLSPEPYRTYQKKVDDAYQEFDYSDREAFYEAMTARVRQVYNTHQDYSLAEVVCGFKQVPAGVLHRQLDTWVKDMENKEFYSKSDCKLDLQDNEEVPTRSAAHRTADGAGADHETAMDEDEVTRLKALLKARDNQIARMHEKAEEDRFIHESDIARLEQDVRALRWENTQLMAQLQEREPIDLEVLKREGVGDIFKGKFGNEALALILKSQERQPRGRRGVKTITVTTRTKTSQWQRIPVGAKSDVDASVELQKFRASNLGYFAERMQMGPNTFQRYMRQATPQAWLPRVKGFTKTALGAEATQTLMDRLGSTWTSHRELRRALRELGGPITLTPENKVRKQLQESEIAGNYSYLDLKGGADGKESVPSLVYTADARQVVQLQADILQASGEAKTWQIPGGRKSHLGMIMNDKGGWSEKVVFTLLGRENPCSPRALTIIGSSEVLNRKNETRQIKSNYENISTLLALIPGYYELNNYTLLRIGPGHVVIPKHTWPENGNFRRLTVSDGEQARYARIFDDFRHNRIDAGTPVDEAQRAAAAAVGGATIVIDRDRSAMGVICEFDVAKAPALPGGAGAGASSTLVYPLRKPVTEALWSLVPGAIEPIELDLYFNADLMALCTFLGADGQAAKIVPHLHGNAATFKSYAKVRGQRTLPTSRTRENDPKGSCDRHPCAFVR